MRVFEVMTEGVRTVSPGMAASEALELMRTDGLHHLVVTSASQVVGVLSARDLAQKRSGARISELTVADVMTTHVATIDRAETIKKAANVMRGRTIGCLPVTDRGRLVGIVTISDLMELIGKGADRPTRSTRATISHSVPHKKKHSGTGMW